MRFNKELLGSVTREAGQSERLRMAHDMLTTFCEQSQRMLNAIEPGTEIAAV